MTQSEEQEHVLARQAFALMDKHQIVPSPEHYALWYRYVQGRNEALIRELDSAMNSVGGAEFNAGIGAYLYNKYIVGSLKQKALDDAARDTGKLLEDVLQIVSDFSGQTIGYNKDVNQSLGKLTASIEETGMKAIVKSLIDATSALKASGEQMSHKLEESRQEINSLRKNLEEVTAESQRDFLTGAYNRKTFEKYYDDYAVQAAQDHTPLCLIAIDVDHFKQFNDRYGHLIGDEVLKIVARVLMDSLKGRDIVARFGGEEFMVLLPDTPPEIAMKVADAVRKTIASKELKRKDTGEIYGSITVSMGVSHYRPASDTLPMVLKRADDALYVSKREGRNRVTREKA
jgi:diguanylate cyclase